MKKYLILNILIMCHCSIFAEMKESGFDIEFRLYEIPLSYSEINSSHLETVHKEINQLSSNFSEKEIKTKNGKIIYHAHLSDVEFDQLISFQHLEGVQFVQSVDDKYKLTKYGNNKIGLEGQFVLKRDKRDQPGLHIEASYNYVREREILKDFPELPVGKPAIATQCFNTFMMIESRKLNNIAGFFVGGNNKRTYTVLAVYLGQLKPIVSGLDESKADELEKFLDRTTPKPVQSTNLQPPPNIVKVIKDDGADQRTQASRHADVMKQMKSKDVLKPLVNSLFTAHVFHIKQNLSKLREYITKSEAEYKKHKPTMSEDEKELVDMMLKDFRNKENLLSGKKQ